MPKQKRYWLRGLFGGVLIGVLLFAFYYIEYLKCEENPVAYGDALGCLGPGLGLTFATWWGIGIILFGLVFGWLYGKIKNRNRASNI